MNRAPETHYAFEPGTDAVVLPDKRRQSVPRIGIYRGSFDPVHAGHIAFALQSQKVAGLEQIYFVPERRPVHGKEPEHYVHRSVMLHRALQPYNQFAVFDLPDAQLTARSLTRLTASAPDADYSLLTTAADLLWHSGPLPEIYHKLHLVIAVTSHAQMAEVLEHLNACPRPFGNLTFVDIGPAYVSSATVRRSIRTGQPVRGILPSVWRYARKQWLYVPPIRKPQG